MTETIYKIRRSDGLFSKGGCNPAFDKKGKLWRHIGHLKNHLNQLEREGLYSNCEIVILQVTETPVDTLSLEDLQTDLAKSRKEREHQMQLRKLAWAQREAKEAVKRAAEFQVWLDAEQGVEE